MPVYVTSAEEHLEDLERIKNFRLLDDDFMTKCFEDQLEATELLVNIILDVNWRVVSVRTQETIKNLQGRSVRLDIHAVTDDGRQVNIEIQRQDKGAAAKRARYHSSVLDANTLQAGEEYNALPDTYVIFITENDVFGYGDPIYFIERYIKGKNAQFDDGAHIVYVNNAVRDDTPLGQLMDDFICTNPDDMHYKVLADRVRFFKETEKGARTMSKALEDMREEVARRVAKETAQNIAETLINIGEMTLESIAMAVKLPLSDVQEIAHRLQPQKFA